MLHSLDLLRDKDWMSVSLRMNVSTSHHELNNRGTRFCWDEILDNFTNNHGQNWNCRKKSFGLAKIIHKKIQNAVWCPGGSSFQLCKDPPSAFRKWNMWHSHSNQSISFIHELFNSFSTSVHDSISHMWSWLYDIPI